jgi:transposase
VAAYLTPPPQTRVICLDELGPLAVKTYPGAEWKGDNQRATFEPDDGRRDIPVWVQGAFEPATGQASFILSDKRDGASHIRLLEHLLTAFPSDRWLLIEDNLSTHKSRDVQTALLAWPEVQVQFIPQYACWLNLIKPWWKQLRSLALKGRRFESRTELQSALTDALAYWNAHKHPYRWKKVPQSQPTLLLGGFGASLEVLPLPLAS